MGIPDLSYKTKIVIYLIRQRFVKSLIQGDIKTQFNPVVMHLTKCCARQECLF